MEQPGGLRDPARLLADLRPAESAHAEGTVRARRTIPATSYVAACMPFANSADRAPAAERMPPAQAGSDPGIASFSPEQ